MRLLTIGVFARMAGLTPKALRIYEKSGLLPPAAVDPDSGYRFYRPGQVPTARLIAELRRIGMPLAEIGQVCELDVEQAVAVISAYGQRITAETAARARMTALLVEHLSGRSTMNPAITLRYASALDQGDVRPSNEDAVHAGDQLLAVADGITGYPAASVAAIGVLKSRQESLQPEDAAGPGLLALLADAVEDADRAVRQVRPAAGRAAVDVEHDQPLATLTAVLRSGSRLALVHIGDSRAYLLRGGELFQLTTDHTWVQSQFDQGKLSSDAAADHPDRALLIRGLGVGNRPVEADLALRTALPGDRYLLCTDGLSSVVSRTALHAALLAATDPQPAVDELLRLAHAAGAPDNIACVVADVVPDQP